MLKKTYVILILIFIDQWSLYHANYNFMLCMSVNPCGKQWEEKNILCFLLNYACIDMHLYNQTEEGKRMHCTRVPNAFRYNKLLKSSKCIFFRGLWLERRTTNNNYFLHIINMGFFFNFAKQLSTSNHIRHNKSHQFMHHDILIFHISQTFALQSSWRSEGYYLVFWRKKNVPADAWLSSKFLNGFDMKKKPFRKGFIIR